jgi:uncharacterized membrane protein
MSWRGSTDIKDRIFSVLPYLLPLFYAMPFGRFLFQEFPFLRLIQIPILPVSLVFSVVPFGLGGIVLFFVLFLAVVRNERISRFIRFNAMQAILLDIALILINLVFSFLLRGINAGILVETLYNVIFIGTLAACIYAIVQSILGKYAEIPTISEAAHSQVR